MKFPDMFCAMQACAIAFVRSSDALRILAAVGPTETESAALDAGYGEWSAQLCVCVNEGDVSDRCNHVV